MAAAACDWDLDWEAEPEVVHTERPCAAAAAAAAVAGGSGMVQAWSMTAAASDRDLDWEAGPEVVHTESAPVQQQQ